MLETHLDSSVTRRRLRTGVAADHIDAFADWLHFGVVALHNRALRIMQRILSRVPTRRKYQPLEKADRAPGLKFRCAKPLETPSSYVF